MVLQRTAGKLIRYNRSRIIARHAFTSLTSNSAALMPVCMYNNRRLKRERDEITLWIPTVSLECSWRVRPGAISCIKGHRYVTLSLRWTSNISWLLRWTAELTGDRARVLLARSFEFTTELDQTFVSTFVLTISSIDLSYKVKKQFLFSKCVGICLSIDWNVFFFTFKYFTLFFMFLSKSF